MGHGQLGYCSADIQTFLGWKMKIIQIMPDFGLAGAEIMVENLTYSLIAEGHRVLVISLYDLHTAITDRLESRNVKIEYLGKKSGFDPAVVPKLRKIIASYQPDVIHTHRYVLPYSFLASIGLKIKCVHTVHSVAQKEQTKTGKIINKVLFRYFHITPVALSAEIQKTIQEVYGLSSQKIPVIFNGIELDRCDAKESYIKKDIFIILHIGRFMDVKNHALLIRSFAQFVKKHPDARLQLLGDGELKEEMIQFAKELGIENLVKFAGLQSNVYPWLHDADVFILPSKFEGMPMTLIQAMGTGLPIIASAVGGITDMLTDKEDALLIEPKEECVLMSLEELYYDEEKRRTMGHKAQQESLRFSSRRMAHEYIKVYANIREENI